MTAGEGVASPRQGGGAPTIPNRTKVVRLIVVPEATATDSAAVRALLASEGAAKTDVFIVGNEPMSWTNGRLTDHHTAIRRDPETVAFVMVNEDEQLQWESSAEFEITKIEKVKEKVSPRFDQNPDAPDNPWSATLEPGAERARPGRPIRSGSALFSEKARQNRLGQLYKFSFRIWVDGKPRDIDPDAYCDM